MTALTGLFLRRPKVLLLDEPTNNLDLAARRRLSATVESWPGIMLIVSHDRELLGLVDQIADLRSDHYGDSLRLYGGNLAAYQAMLEVEQAAARRAVGAAEADVQRRRRAAVESQTKQAGRDRRAASWPLPAAFPGRRWARASAAPRRARGGPATCMPSASPTRKRGSRRRKKRFATTTRSGSRCRGRRCPRAGPCSP